MVAKDSIQRRQFGLPLTITVLYVRLKKKSPKFFFFLFLQLRYYLCICIIFFFMENAILSDINRSSKIVCLAKFSVSSMFLELLNQNFRKKCSMKSCSPHATCLRYTTIMYRKSARVFFKRNIHFYSYSFSPFQFSFDKKLLDSKEIFFLTINTIF